MELTYKCYKAVAVLGIKMPRLLFREWERWTFLRKQTLW